MKSRVEFYPRHHSTKYQMEGFEIVDWNAKLKWVGVLANSTIRDCGLHYHNEPYSVYCPSHNATLLGSATIGESYKTDIYNFRHPHDKGFMLDVECVVEAGSLSKPIQQNVIGEFDSASGRQEYFVEHTQYWDLTEGPIDQSMFTIPAGCPPS